MLTYLDFLDICQEYQAFLYYSLRAYVRTPYNREWLLYTYLATAYISLTNTIQSQT